MRSDAEILGLIARARRDKAAARLRAEREREEEIARRKVFFQAARAVFLHVVLPGAQRLSGLCAQADLRAMLMDTGSYYLPGATDPDITVKFQMPVGRGAAALPLCVVFKARFPDGVAIAYVDPDGDLGDAKGPVETVDLGEVTPDLVEERLLRVLANFLHEM